MAMANTRALILNKLFSKSDHESNNAGAIELCTIKSDKVLDENKKVSTSLPSSPEKTKRTTLASGNRTLPSTDSRDQAVCTPTRRSHRGVNSRHACDDSDRLVGRRVEFCIDDPHRLTKPTAVQSVPTNRRRILPRTPTVSSPDYSGDKAIVTAAPKTFPGGLNVVDKDAKQNDSCEFAIAAKQNKTIDSHAKSVPAPVSKSVAKPLGDNKSCNVNTETHSNQSYKYRIKQDLTSKEGSSTLLKSSPLQLTNPKGEKYIKSRERSIDYPDSKNQPILKDYKDVKQTDTAIYDTTASLPLCANKTDRDKEHTVKFPTTHKHYLSPDICPSMLDKLQRLQNQSSTETSGLGETITSGFSSQESIASCTSANRPDDNSHAINQDQGIDLREDTTHIKTIANSTSETGDIDHKENDINIPYELGDEHRADGVKCAPTSPLTSPSCRNPHSVNETKCCSDNTVINQPMNVLLMQEGLLVGPTEQPNNKASAHTKSAEQPNTSSKPDTLDLEPSYNAGPDFDELFFQSETLQVPQQNMGLNLEQINSEWNKHTRSSSIKSIKSRSSCGSFRSRSGSTRRSRRFLSQKESKWMTWGKARRASYRRRLDKLEKPDPEVPARASTPVKKARQEGLMFIHPDLESKYISEEDINYIQKHRQQRLQTYKVIEKSKNIKSYAHQHHDMNRLTVGDLNVLTRFWEHRIFLRSRYISILLSIVTILIYIISICSSQWISYPSEDVPNHQAHEGLWYRCQPDSNMVDTCDTPATRDAAAQSISKSVWDQLCFEPLDNTTANQCLDTLPHWQNAVIGLMIFSAAFGFVAAVLAICGVFTSPLPRKIYYFHSSGEIFFVCALTTTVALVIYPVAIAMDTNILTYTYGSGYGLGWGGTAFFFAAALCMSLDELVRESAQNKCCRYICWRARTREQQQV